MGLNNGTAHGESYSHTINLRRVEPLEDFLSGLRGETNRSNQVMNTVSLSSGSPGEASKIARHGGILLA
jgi:hypothetical protein